VKQRSYQEQAKPQGAQPSHEAALDEPCIDHPTEHEASAFICGAAKIHHKPSKQAQTNPFALCSWSNDVH
jgi:hypothetical protein